MEKSLAKVSYQKGSVGDAVRSAKKLKATHDLYVYPTGAGMEIGKTAPPFGVQHIIIKPDGSHQIVSRSASFEAGRKAGIEPVPFGEVAPTKSAPIKEEIMDKECKVKCLNAGMELFRSAEALRADKRSPILFTDNVRGLVPGDIKVPHSELAMHVKAAGKDIIAWVLTPNYAYVVFDEGDGTCGFTHGLDDEVLPHEAINKTREIWGPKEK